MSGNLHEVFSPESFRNYGHELIDLLADHLHDTMFSGTSPVLKWREPEDQLAYWKNYSVEEKNVSALFADILQNSIHVHHKKFIGHQQAPASPVSILASLVSSVLNNGMAVYEMGSAASAIEKIVTDIFARLTFSMSRSDRKIGSA